MTTDKLSYTIPQFCDLHGISREMIYKLWRDGRGPRRMKVGSRTLISHEAAADWRRQCETEQEGAA